MELNLEIARKFARIALGHVAREYPHKLDHVIAGNTDVQSPRTLHPVFFGSFDWHSCVHGWWTLMTVKRLFPAMPEAANIDALAQSTFTPEKLAVECAYLDRPSSRGFERPYGWGWLLYLHHEACLHTDREWGDRLEPLARKLADMLKSYLAMLTYPITVGTHYNTAFALILAREWAMERDGELAQTIDAWTRRAFGSKSDYCGWEPGGDEFLSPSLTATSLLSRVMEKAEFTGWLEDFLPDGRMEELYTPATVSDRSDGKTAHLDGLNLSRAWCLDEIADALSPHDRAPTMRYLAGQHLDSAMDHIDGDYMGEHWLASFALLALL